MKTNIKKPLDLINHEESEIYAKEQVDTP